MLEGSERSLPPLRMLTCSLFSETSYSTTPLFNKI